MKNTLRLLILLALFTACSPKVEQTEQTDVTDENQTVTFPFRAPKDYSPVTKITDSDDKVLLDNVNQAIYVIELALGTESELVTSLKNQKFVFNKSIPLAAWDPEDENFVLGPTFKDYSPFFQFSTLAHEADHSIRENRGPVSGAFAKFSHKACEEEARVYGNDLNIRGPEFKELFSDTKNSDIWIDNIDFVLADTAMFLASYELGQKLALFITLMLDEFVAYLIQEPSIDSKPKLRRAALINKFAASIGNPDEMRSFSPAEKFTVLTIGTQVSMYRLVYSTGVTTNAYLDFLIRNYPGLFQQSFHSDDNLSQVEFYADEATSLVPNSTKLREAAIALKAQVKTTRDKKQKIFRQADELSKKIAAFLETQ